MAKGREIKLNLPAADDLFSTQEERNEAKREYVADIPLKEISDFPNHPYKVKQDESMLELAASIREKGVSAFANGSGGILVFGVADNDNIIGLADIKSASELSARK
ncbi:RNA-binding domain-containing protein [Diplocloster agilis]|uniref:RNA-binding domain-containing protein n=1 Tax=Diplocloster agilis TaxID=2850323 RepID=UPI0008218804|nr:RNA-binding domain-containing protein [Suonthocola fibrivorans]MCU6733498.1 putative DNA binding domain-containing protein [Suonthocola fibrivorans]SCI94925.1 Divergent AAA domain [uncultured Clostridium sp.]